MTRAMRHDNKTLSYIIEKNLRATFTFCIILSISTAILEKLDILKKTKSVGIAVSKTKI